MIFREVLDLFNKAALDADAQDYANESTQLRLPILPLKLIEDIIDKATSIFSNESNLIRLSNNDEGRSPPSKGNGAIFNIRTNEKHSIEKVDKIQSEYDHIEKVDDSSQSSIEKVIVVGDLHGHILDLFRIFREVGLPPKNTFIFLGDLIDRGEFSTELIIYLFLLKINYKDKVYIIRGNHEFAVMALHNGFSNELFSIYRTESLQTSFFHAFSYIPLAVLYNDTILMVHGGIGPSIHDLQTIENIKRPIFDFNNESLVSLVWSDPDVKTETFSKSLRGTGFKFGEKALNDFLINNKLEMIVRAHECVESGFTEMFNGRLLTIFSASSYCGTSNNSSSVIIFTLNNSSSNEPNQSEDCFQNNVKNIIESNADINKNENVVFIENKFDSKEQSRDTKPKINYSTIRFPPLPYLRRTKATFFEPQLSATSIEIDSCICQPVKFGSGQLSPTSGACINSSPQPKKLTNAATITPGMRLPPLGRKMTLNGGIVIGSGRSLGRQAMKISVSETIPVKQSSSIARRKPAASADPFKKGKLRNGAARR